MSVCCLLPVLLGHRSLFCGSCLSAWPDTKSGTQESKACNVSVLLVCSVSTAQDTEITNLPETVCLKLMEFLTEYM